MKLLVLVLIAGLVSLTACRQTPEASAIDHNAAMIADSLERQADNMEAMAGNVADPNMSDALENAADRLDDVKDNVADAADAAKARINH